MSKTTSVYKTAWDNIKQWSLSILAVILFTILIGDTVWEIYDSRTGHQEVKTAIILEKVYKRAVDDVMFVPTGDGGMMTIDTSTPARFIIKLALEDREVVKVKVRKSQFKILDVGESVSFKRWVGKSGIVYRKSIISNNLNQDDFLHS